MLHVSNATTPNDAITHIIKNRSLYIPIIGSINKARNQYVQGKLFIFTAIHPRTKQKIQLSGKRILDIVQTNVTYNNITEEQIGTIYKHISLFQSVIESFAKIKRIHLQNLIYQQKFTFPSILFPNVSPRTIILNRKDIITLFNT